MAWQIRQCVVSGSLHWALQPPQVAVTGVSRLLIGWPALRTGNGNIG
ncbi:MULTISPECIES: hypothetical protein [unclassified Frankia]